MSYFKNLFKLKDNTYDSFSLSEIISQWLGNIFIGFSTYNDCKFLSLYIELKH